MWDKAFALRRLTEEGRPYALLLGGFLLLWLYQMKRGGYRPVDVSLDDLVD